MDNYNFWQDAFDTYQSLSLVMQFAWLVLPPLFVLGLVALVLRFWLLLRRLGPPGRGEPVCTLYRNDFGAYDLYRHDGAEADGGAAEDRLEVPRKWLP